MRIWGLGFCSRYVHFLFLCRGWFGCWRYCVLIDAQIIPSVYHPAGTCAKMPREWGGVVDEDLKVYGVTGLSIVDASIFPTLIGATTSMTVYAVAEKVGFPFRERHLSLPLLRRLQISLNFELRKSRKVVECSEWRVMWKPENENEYNTWKEREKATVCAAIGCFSSKKNKWWRLKGGSLI